MQEPKPELEIVTELPEDAVPVDFSKYHLHIAMPCFAGQVSEATMSSMFKFILAAQDLKLNWSFDSISNESLVTRARNNLSAKMMYNQNATHCMFIDADIRFEPLSIFQMIAADKDVIGGLYPKKGYPVSYAVNLNEQTDIQGDIFTVDSIGTGFLMFKKDVYLKICHANPETKYVDEVFYGKEYEPFMYSIFDTMIINGRYLSEDWTFCERWKRIGGTIWAHGKVLLDHTGYHEFLGDLSKLPDFAQPRGDISDIEPDGEVPDALHNTLKMLRPEKLPEKEEK